MGRLPGDRGLGMRGLIARLVGSDPASMSARALADELLPGRLGPYDTVVGLGWATVETDRAIAEAADGMEPDARPDWGPPVREAALGASALTAPVGDVTLVVLEPDTEGRVAAFLARYGEGVCVAYVEGKGPGGMLRPTALRVPGRLRAHATPWGPFVIAVESGGSHLPDAAGPPR